MIIVSSCKNNKKEVINTSEESIEENTINYPDNLMKIFDAHGGLDAWNKMQSLEFTMPKPEGEDIITVNLKNRKSLLEKPNHTIGFNGENVWLYSKDTIAFNGNPKFYYNLMFYFYAMPFVLADEGINYTNAEPLIHQGKSYPGIKITYQNGVGESSEDEYILYYDSETFKMAWLAYTVTYFSKEKSSELHFRKYDVWQDINGVLLPKSIVRYNYEANNPTTVHSEDTFINVKLSPQAPDNDLFEMPEGAEITE